MRGRIAHKLRSEQGASMSMALMLFLVCTVVASITITAASASAGRLSQLRETDRSYYSVTSAANVIWDLLKESNESNDNGVITRIVRTRDKDNKWSFSLVDSNGDELITDSAINITGDTKNATFFEAAACAVVFNTDLENTIAADKIKVGDSFTTPTYVPKDPAYSKLDDASINLAVDSGFSGKLNDVQVTFKRVDGSMFDIEFHDVSSSNSYCTITAYMNVDSKPEVIDETTGNHQWTTIVTWQPLYLSMGGA